MQKKNKLWQMKILLQKNISTILHNSRYTKPEEIGPQYLFDKLELSLRKTGSFI